MKKTFSILVLFLFSYCCFAQLNVTAALDSTTILLGDQIQLNFKITKPSNTEYLSADFKTTLDSIEQLELIEIKQPSTTSIGSNEVVNQSILITSFEDGTHQIPQFLFSSQSNGNVETALSNPVYLKVSPIEIDTTAELRPIKNIIEEKIKLSDWIHYVLIPLAILLAIGLIIFLITRIKRKKRAAVPVLEKKVFVPAHIIAYKKIMALQEKELWQKGKIKPYYSEISYIAREYLENRYHINALESVTHEIIPELKEKGIQEQLQQQFIKTLRTADMVKFAKVKPSEDTHHSVIEQLKEFIKATLKEVNPNSENPQNNDNQA